jgi:hypothetical protein
MLMVIFGAGASFDSSAEFRPPSTFGVADPHESWRPPLADKLFQNQKHLFSDIVRRYPKLAPILPRLRRPHAGRSLEQQLEIFQNEASEDPERKRQLFSVRYYLYELFREISEHWLKETDGVTNYASLIDQIRRRIPSDEPIALVTFNYDTLLDRALRAFNYQPQNDLEQHFDSHPQLKLFRPHGSVEWSRLTNHLADTRLTPTHLIEQADSFELSEKYIVGFATDSHNLFNHGRPIVPAIAIPTQTKTNDTFEWPKSHRDYLAELIPSVRKILIIGWQAKEAHFLQMLNSNLTNLSHVMIVGKDAPDSIRIFDYFVQEIGKTPSPLFRFFGQSGFSHFVSNDDEGEEFLTAK